MTKINVCDHVNTQILLVYIQHHTNATNHMLELVNKSYLVWYKIKSTALNVEKRKLQKRN